MIPSPRTPAKLSALLLILFIAAGLSSCGRQEAQPESPGSDSLDSLPPAELTERGARDSARVAELVTAYFARVATKDRDAALELFFPESLRVATPDGAIEIEGRSSENANTIAADETTAAPLRRIVLLRRASRELLENTYRETWAMRYIPDREDSAAVERRFHVLQQLGNDTRWLGRFEAARQ